MSGYSAPRPISEGDEVAGFDSGEPSLDDYLRGRALANHVEGASRCFVTCCEGRDAMNEIGPDVVEAVTYVLSAHKQDCSDTHVAGEDLQRLGQACAGLADDELMGKAWDDQHCSEPSRGLSPMIDGQAGGTTHSKCRLSSRSVCTDLSPARGAAEPK